MDEYESNVTIDEVGRLLDGADRVVVTTHAKPDADAFGAVKGLTCALRRRGAEARALFMGPVPANLAQLWAPQEYALLETAGGIADCDLVVIVDTGAWSQISKLREELTPALGRTLIIDHHRTGNVEAAWRWIDSRASACCEMIGRLLDREPRGRAALEDPPIRDALFVGLAADTGWFRFSNTTAQTHEWAARFRRGGVDHADLYRRLEQTQRPEKLALISRALSSLVWVADQRGAVMVLRDRDFAETGALIEETEQIIDLPQMVGSVEVVALVTQSGPEDADAGERAVRLSFRSKPGDGAVDVARLAGDFAGGGHVRAAGARVCGALEEVVQRVQDAVARALRP